MAKCVQPSSPQKQAMLKIIGGKKRRKNASNQLREQKKINLCYLSELNVQVVLFVSAHNQLL